jgi:cytochrome d ubiquinol oxidase subunit I
VVGISGLVSGILVVAANAWMNSPAGFDYVNGQYINIDPIKAMFNDAWFSQALHMSIAAFVATGFAVAGIHALMMLKGKNVVFHTRAFRIAAIFATVAAVLQPLSGDISAKDVAIRQPAKLAAMEAHFHTEKAASLIIGGIPDVGNQKVDYAIKIPGALSFLAHGNFKAEVKGLDSIKPEEHPPVAITHYAFQVMVGLGVLMLLIAVLYFIALWRKKTWRKSRWLMKLFVIATPMGFIAVEAGWTVTEVGRQPWIINGVMKTADAVTPMPGIIYSFYLFTAVYVSLALIVSFMLVRQIKMVDRLYDLPEDANQLKH